MSTARAHEAVGDYQRFGVPDSGVVEAVAVDPERPPEIIDERVDVGSDSIDMELSRELQREESGWLNPLRWVRGPTALAIAALLGGGIVLIVLHHVLAVLSNISSLPQWGQWATYGVLGLVLLAIGLAAGRLIFAFARLRATPRLSMRALRELSERAVLRETARSDLDAARSSLRKILDEHPVATPKKHPALRRAGMSAELIDRVERDRRVLLDEYAEIAPSAWLERYRTLFVRPLDEAAKRAIRKRSLLVGAKTAALPNGGLDTAVSITHAFLLVGDLCTIYNVRTGRHGVAAITWRVLLGAFVAGRVEDLTDEAANQLGQALGGAATGAFAKAGSAIAGKLVGKTAEGLVNAAFCYRLGIAAMKRLRPLD